MWLKMLLDQPNSFVVVVVSMNQGHFNSANFLEGERVHIYVSPASCIHTIYESNINICSFNAYLYKIIL